ncbi:unnamed protein product [Phaeothamnion confervicola]
MKPGSWPWQQQLLLFALVFLWRHAVGDPLQPGDGPPPFPLQFVAVLETTAHLVDRQKEYPPWRGRMELHYDHPAGLAMAIITDGLEANKTYIRRYDQRREYMIRRGDWPICRRSYMGEKMPLPQLPAAARRHGPAEIDGRPVQHWIHETGPSRVHFWLEGDTRSSGGGDSEGSHGNTGSNSGSNSGGSNGGNSGGSGFRGLPRRLTEEAVMTDGTVTPLMTYDLLELWAVPPDPASFELLPPYMHKAACEIHVGGYPYIRAFHHYLMF